MRVAMTGATGLIGGTLTRTLRADGHQVTGVTRSTERANRPDMIRWDPRAGEIDRQGLEGHDVVVHLAGEPLFGVWTPHRKERIRRSRVEGTRLVATTLADLERPPRLLVTASAIGFYGDNPPDEPLDESAPAGDNWMATVVRDWEAAARPAQDAGIRVAHMRTGLVLSPDGGVLRLLLPLFRAGLGGVPGPGDQVWSWIALPDLAPVLRRIIDDDTLRGPVNVTAPGAVTAQEFARGLGRVLGRPVLLRVPGPIFRLTPGHMGEEMVLSSARVVPAKLEERGHSFGYPEYEGALRAVLGNQV